MKLRKAFRRLALPLVLLAALPLSGCGQERFQAESLGEAAYAAKTLDGLFYSHNGELYLISGTEVAAGSESQVFVYNVSQDELIMSQTLENCVSMTAFCEVGETLYFATIAAISTSPGCDLYAWDKAGGEIRACAHFPERGIYDLAWNGGGELFAATSHPTGLYAYDLSAGTVRPVCLSPTEEPYVRSLSGGGGHLYLGIGTKADLIEVDPDTGAFRSVLPEKYRPQSFVYAQTSYQDKIIFRMSHPDFDILVYDPASAALTDSGLTFQQGAETLAGTGLYPEGYQDLAALDLWGDQLLIDSGGTIAGQISTKGVASWLDQETGCVYRLTGSTFCQRFSPEGELLFQRDLSTLLEKTWVIPTEFLAYDGNIYIPSRRFIVRRDGEERVFLVEDEPQASTVTADGVYTANYTEATVYFYPFSVFDEDPASVNMNDPDRFLLADIKDQCRPRQMEVSIDGRYLVVGTGPMYGKFGGAVSVYDLREKRLLYTHPHVVQNHQVAAVKCSPRDPNLVWLGLCAVGENTNPAVLDEPAHLILWDIAARSVVLDILPDGNPNAVQYITERDGRVYCAQSGGVLSAFDAETGALLARNEIDPDIRGFLQAKDGSLFAVNYTELLRIDPRTLQTETVLDGFSVLSRLTEDPVTGTLYLFDNAELYRIRRD